MRHPTVTIVRPVSGGTRRVGAAVLLGSLVALAPLSAQVATPAGAGAISTERLMDTVRELASPEYEGRGAGTPGGLKARAYVQRRFEAAGLRPVGSSFEHPFSFRTERASGGAPEDLSGANLLGLCPGTGQTERVIVVSAHYDHLGTRDGRIHPGADDNASGVAVLLELAAACRAEPFRHAVLFAAFDAEERGLRGARAFVAHPPVPLARLALNLNLDMVARGDKGELFAAGLYHYPALRPLLEPVARTAPITLRFGHDTPGSGHDDWTTQSDHGAFHAAKIPFVYFGVEDHPDYHAPTDTADKIDPVFFTRAATVVLDALRALDRGLE